MMGPRKSTDPVYVLTMPMGLDGVAVEELGRRAPDAIVTERSSTELCLTYGGSPRDLLALRSVNDAWVVVRERSGTGPAYRDLHMLTAWASRTTLEPTLAALTEAGLRFRHALTFSLTCSMRGERAYRRVDALEAVQDGLVAQKTLHLRPTKGQAMLRLWLHLEDDRARLCAALSARPLHLRARAVSLPASLPGPVAYAMAHMTRPQPGDVFADLTCGSGSVALERAENWRYAYLLAGDLESRAVQAAAANFGPRHKPRSLLRWDATALPLASASVNAAACNPPHGIQMQPAAGLEPLYKGILSEAARILRPHGRFTWLTPLRELTDRLLVTGDSFRIERCFVIDLLGQRPYLYVLRRS